MITFYGYAVRNGSRWLGYQKSSVLNDKIRPARFYKSPQFPVVCAKKKSITDRYGKMGEVVKVKLTMEEGAGDGE